MKLISYTVSLKNGDHWSIRFNIGVASGNNRVGTLRKRLLFANGLVVVCRKAKKADGKTVVSSQVSGGEVSEEDSKEKHVCHSCFHLARLKQLST